MLPEISDTLEITARDLRDHYELGEMSRSLNLYDLCWVLESLAFNLRERKKENPPPTV